MKRKVMRSASLVLCVIMLLSCVAFATDSEVDYEAKLDEAIELYRKNSLFGNEDTDYIKDALVEMFEEDDEFFYEFMDRIYSKNDRYSAYMSPTTYEESYELENTMVGIGVVISVEENSEYLKITSVSTGPAKEAGLLPGDKLATVDGFDVSGFLPAEAGAVVKGKEGTTVKIGVIRGEEYLEFTVKRAPVAISEVTSAKLTDKIGYIKFEHFSGIGGFIDFMEVYDDFEVSGINTIILDLRDNPGGELSCFVNLMDNIVPKKDVPYLMAWQTKPLRLSTFVTEGYGWEFNKFIILVNGNTASAAELMAGSLQDLGYAVVVGETTYGKGMGQVHLETSTGDEAVITGLELKLPVSGGYDCVGIKPDYVVKNRVKKYTLPYLTPLKEKSAISKIKTENVKAVEERLACLGYFYAEPDDTWDRHTVHAINLFCREYGYNSVSSSCSWELIQKIDKETQNLKYKYVMEDTQYEKAYKLAEEYAASDKKAECVDLSRIDFKRGEE